MKENSDLNKPVGIWIRVSTEDQAEGESPDHHEERARSYAKSRGWQVKELYDLAGQSGKAVMQHAEAKRMMKDIERGHITGLVFSKLARLSRNRCERIRLLWINLVSVVSPISEDHSLLQSVSILRKRRLRKANGRTSL